MSSAANGGARDMEFVPTTVTYSDLIQIGILIVSICGLVYQICKKK